MKIATYNINGINGVTEYKWLDGYKYGFGVATSLSQTLDLRLEYYHESYRKFQNNNFPGFPGKLRTIALKPEVDVVQLALIYNF